MKVTVITACITTAIVVAFGSLFLPADKKGETPEDAYYAFRYQRVVYISEGRVAGGPEKFGVVKSNKGAETVKLLAKKLPVKDDDKPAFATHATDKLLETVVFSSLTPITKDEFDIATKSKAISVSLEP